MTNIALFRLPSRPLRLAFFGTPEFARAVLEPLLDAPDDALALVVCQPDRPRGRRRKLQPPPVKELATARGVELIQPRKMKDGSVARALAERNIDLAIVAAYGRILQQDTLDATPFGFWNVHGSLLPRHRGASPIQHAIWCGDDASGVDLMQMSFGLDEGPVLDRRVVPLQGRETATQLAEQLAALGGPMVLDALRRAKTEGLEIRPQDDADATYARLLTKEDGILDFTMGAAAIDRQIRALDGWPGTYLPTADGPLKIQAATPIAPDQTPAAWGQRAPGTVLSLDNALILATGDGALRVDRIQPPGKRPMSAADFLRGAGRELTVGAPLAVR